MCYYATTDYRCGDWKWGNMKLRCPRQHRMGETCGAKLVHHESITKISEDCRLCQEITIKQRRLQRERDNIARWSRENGKFTASIEKAQRESKQLEETIIEMYNRRPSVMLNRNGPSGGYGGAQPASASVNSYSSTPAYGSSQSGYSGGGRLGTSHPNSGSASGGTTGNRHSVQHPGGHSSRR